MILDEKREYYSAYSKAYRATSPKYKKYIKGYREKNKQHNKLYMRMWRAKKGIKRKIRFPARRVEERRRRIREYSVKADRKRRLNVGYRLSRNVGRQIRLALHGEETAINWRTRLGYSLKELQKHLEKQFTTKMSWQNYGKYWWIDHRIPQSKFNQEHIEDFRTCWELENLRPMEKIANIVKGNKYSEPTLNQFLYLQT